MGLAKLIPNLETTLSKMWFMYRIPENQLNIGVGPMALVDCDYYNRRGHLLFFEFQLSLVRLVNIIFKLILFFNFQNRHDPCMVLGKIFV